MTQQPLLWVANQKTLKTFICEGMCTPVFTCIVHVANTWKQPSYPSEDGWGKEVWGVTMGHHSAVRKGEIQPFVPACLCLGNITLHEVSPPWKWRAVCAFPRVWAISWRQQTDENTQTQTTGEWLLAGEGWSRRGVRIHGAGRRADWGVRTRRSTQMMHSTVVHFKPV